MSAPPVIAELVARFQANRKLYSGPGYKELQLCREFLEPFFEALGWDVQNKAGVSPVYQEVVQQYGTEVEGGQKSADYAFRVGEKVRFFVEAKKPGVRLKDDAGPAYQLRKYAYSKDLPLSILTDFEEFAVYDGRVKPQGSDAASKARVLYLACEEYSDRWEEVAAAFSRDAVWKGGFDKFAEENKGGKHEPLDKTFLALLERWRDALARNVSGRNRELELSDADLTWAVQAVVDRIIFLRVAEARGLEGESRLLELARGEDVYRRLVDLFREADDRYNSGLFHFREEKGRPTRRDDLTPRLALDDAVVRKVVRELYDSPFEFAVVPVEILGQAYEQFLGKTIHVDGRGVHIDLKAEVRKAKGVYYTPQYIVDYIVANTIGELLKVCKTPADAAKLRVLDPACGSGSFLLGAYRRLMDWHLNWYYEDGPAKHGGELVGVGGAGGAGNYRLSIAEKKRILLNNIYGVDIDAQAVEVTKLSLLLKALEGESRESIGAQQKLLKDRALPDLGANVKCGNSLIGPDYFEGRLVGAHGSAPAFDDERERVNPFDWAKEFPQVFKTVGLSPLSKELGYWLVTFVTHNSRVSERMTRLKIKAGEPLIFTPDDQEVIARALADGIQRYGVRALAANVLPDHVHLVVGAANEKELNEVIRKLKGYMAHEFLKGKGFTGEALVWARKFNRKVLADDNAIGGAIAYVDNNHHKHAERWGENLVKTYETRLRLVLEALRGGDAPGSLDSGLKPTVSSGFDAVIGNPPWVNQLFISEYKTYLKKAYSTFVNTADLYVCFIEQSFNLLKDNGYFGFITSNKWMKSNYGLNLRRFIKGRQIKTIVDFGTLKLFAKATTYPAVVIARNTKRVDPFKYTPVRNLKFSSLSAECDDVGYTLTEDAIAEAGFSLSTGSDQKVIDKIKATGIPLESYIDNKIYYGIKTAYNKAFVIDKGLRDKFLKRSKKNADIVKPFLMGKDIKRYYIHKDNQFVLLTRIGVPIKEFPTIFEYLKKYQVGLSARTDQGNFWWELRACDYYGEFLKPKIVWPGISKEITAFGFDTEGYYGNDNIQMIITDDLYVLGILNSSVSRFFLKSICDKVQGGFYRLKVSYVSQIPIYRIVTSSNADVARHDKMVALVERMLDLHKRKQAAKTPNEQDRLEREIKATDAATDALVYVLYGLTEEEIKIVEGS